MTARQKWWLRALFSGGALTYLFLAIDVAPLKEKLAGFHWGYYSLGILAVVTSVYLQSQLLRVLLHAHGILTGLWALMKQMITSVFLGLLLPGGSGPDLVMGYQLFKNPAGREAAVGVLIFMRGAGMLAMVGLAAIAAMSSYCQVPGLAVFLWLLLAGAFAGWLVFQFHLAASVTGRLFAFMRHHTITAAIYQTFAEMTMLSRKRRELLESIPLFLASSCLKVLLDVLAARALGIQVPLPYFFLLAPLVTVAGTIPLSIAGLGIREGTYVGLWTALGLGANAADAMAVSLVSFSFSLWLCLGGAILFAQARRQ